MLISNCCTAPPFRHVEVMEDGTMIGMCRDCKEHAEFVEDDELDKPLGSMTSHLNRETGDK